MSFAGARIPSPRILNTFVDQSYAKCQIGLAITMCANEHGGAFPASLHEILETEDITEEVFVCPASNDTPAFGPNTRAVLDDFDRPGHCSYIYLGKGLSINSDPGTPVLYDSPTIHQSGMNVLFADGHAEFCPGTDSQAILNAIAVRSTLNSK